MPDQQFGPLVSYHDVEFGFVGHMKTWLPTFLAARERKVGVTPGSIARPKSWVTRQTFSILPGEESTPTIAIVSSGTNEGPIFHGDGMIDVKLRTAVAAITLGAEATIARRVAGHYQAALLDMLLKKKSFTILQGSVTVKIDEWLGVSLDDLDETIERTYASARLEFVTVVRDFANRFGGPETVPADPLIPQPDSPTVQDTTVGTDALT